MVGVLIVGEAPTMRNSYPSTLAKVLAMDGVFFRGFWIKVLKTIKTGQIIEVFVVVTHRHYPEGI